MLLSSHPIVDGETPFYICFQFEELNNMNTHGLAISSKLLHITENTIFFSYSIFHWIYTNTMIYVNYLCIVCYFCYLKISNRNK